MPREPLSGAVAELPRESRLEGTYTRTAVQMDGALVVYAWLEATFTLPPGTDPDVHPFDQLVHVISGRLRLVVGDQEYLLAAGDVCYVPGGVPHSGGPVDGPVHFMEIFAPARDDYVHLAAHQGGLTS
jgi:mannose-6-phosphate isomerase-like protein (cupin superfamily)